MQLFYIEKKPLNFYLFIYLFYFLFTTLLRLSQSLLLVPLVSCSYSYSYSCSCSCSHLTCARAFSSPFRSLLITPPLWGGVISKELRSTRVTPPFANQRVFFFSPCFANQRGGVISK